MMRKRSRRRSSGPSLVCMTAEARSVAPESYLRLRSVTAARLVEVHDARATHVALALVARDAADLLHDRGHAFRFLVERLHEAAMRIVGRELLEEQLRVAHHGSERLIELVRGAARELGDRGLLLGLDQRGLRFLQAALHREAIADVREETDGRDLAAFVVVDDRGGEEDRNRYAIAREDFCFESDRESDAALLGRAQH